MATTQHDEHTVDLLVIGSGTGMAAALSAHEAGLSVLIVEKSQWAGGSTARSGGAFWVPRNPILAAQQPADSESDARRYIRAVVGDTAPAQRGDAFIDHGADAIAMLSRTTPMKFFWAKGYSDYHPEEPGGSAVGRTCECKPFDLAVLGENRGRLRPGLLDAPLPMPVTGADYKWLNLITSTPVRSMRRVLKALGVGVGGLALGRHYVAGGQALAAGLFAGVLRAGIPIWYGAHPTELLSTGERIDGAMIDRDGTLTRVRARKGIVLAAGGFDHDMTMRHRWQSPMLADNASLGAESNTGDAIVLGQQVGAAIDSMDQSWWFPAVAAPKDGVPSVLLAERSLPGSFIVDQTGRRFINEATDYMSFGQRILARERDGDPVTDMWIIFDQRYRNSYVFGGAIFPRQPLPQTWYEQGIAHRSGDPADLAAQIGVPADGFGDALRSFNAAAESGIDHEFGRGASAYDRYYGDPSVTPNPNVRPLTGELYAVRMVLSDLGTCGGLRADSRARVLREDNSVIAGLYAIGNTAANAFGASYPGAGATIGQGLVYGHIAALDAAGKVSDSTSDPQAGALGSR